MGPQVLQHLKKKSILLHSSVMVTSYLWETRLGIWLQKNCRFVARPSVPSVFADELLKNESSNGYKKQDSMEHVESMYEFISYEFWPEFFMEKYQLCIWLYDNGKWIEYHWGERIYSCFKNMFVIDLRPSSKYKWWSHLENCCLDCYIQVNFKLNCLGQFMLYQLSFNGSFIQHSHEYDMINLRQ